MIDTPLLTVFGASNELPEEDESLEALYDRFLFRYDVRYIQIEENVKTLLFSPDTVFSPPVTLTTEMVAQIRSQARSVSIPEEVQNSILSLKRQLEYQDGEDDGNVQVSDRRWKKITGVLKVAAAANGTKTVDRTMLLLLQHLLWDLPEQKDRIRSIIIEHMVTGGTDTKRLEVGIRQVHRMLTQEDGIHENARLPVPVFAHDSDGNKQKIISFGELIAASKEKKYYYFSIETSFSTGYPFSQIMGILESEYQFSPKRYLASEIREICEAEYANLMEEYQKFVNTVRDDSNLLKQNLEANIWLTCPDIDEVLSVRQNYLARLPLLEENMNALSVAIRS